MSCATDGKNRVRPSAAVYRALMEAVEARRLELGISMATVNDIAGLQDGFFSRMIYPDTPSGRQARWETVDLAMEALFGRDYVIKIEPGIECSRSMPSLDKGISNNSLQIRHWRHSRHFKTLGASGGAIRMSKLSKKARIRLARKAGRASMKKLTAAERKEKARNASIARWKRARAAQRQGEAHHEANTKSGKVRHLQSAAVADRGRDPSDVRIRPGQRAAAS